MTIGSTHLYDPLDPAVLADPFPSYRSLRDEAPVAYLEADDLWVISRYDDVVAALRQPELFSSELGMGALMRGEISPRMPGRAPTRDLTGFRVLIAADPPDHTKLRRLANRPFTPRAIAAMEPRIRQITEALVDDLIGAAGHSDADLVTHLAYPLPVIVIAEMLGIPTERRDDFKRWSDDMVGGLSGDLDPDKSLASSIEMFQFFSAEIDHRRRQPGSDLISLLVSGPPEDQLNTPELVMFCVLLLIAGNETTTNLIANQAQAFFDNPDQHAAATADRGLIAGSVEEALRYNGPVHGLFRQTRTATTLAGTDIPADARVLLLFAAANRDERHYPDPDTYDITRHAADHLAFGGGIHLCLGAPLARLEAAVAWDVLLDRCPQLQPSAPATPFGGFILRGASHVPVTL